MIQTRGGVRLLLEAPKPVFVFREVTGYELDGHGTAQGGVVREIHLAHPACAEQGTNFIPTQSCPRGQMHDGDASQSWHIAFGLWRYSKRMRKDPRGLAATAASAVRLIGRLFRRRFVVVGLGGLRRSHLRIAMWRASTQSLSVPCGSASSGSRTSGSEAVPRRETPRILRLRFGRARIVGRWQYRYPPIVNTRAPTDAKSRELCWTTFLTQGRCRERPSFHAAFVVIHCSGATLR